MIRETNIGMAAVLMATACMGLASAAVTPEEAKQLSGGILTQFGAEKAGNKEGTIPPYLGEGLEAPAGFGSDPKDPYKRPDPFAAEKPLFSITAQNAAQYADKLDGMVAMFKVYPNFRMDIYPSHRTVVYPKNVLVNTVANATACKGADNEVRIEGCLGGLAFPIPKTGAQVMWNHLTGYRAHAWKGFSNSYVVAKNGAASLVAGNRMWQQSPYYDPKQTSAATGKTVYWGFRMNTESPARKAGEKLVIIDPVDLLNVGRRVYMYIPGQRRVKLAPDLAYDTPSPSSGGGATMDDAQVFSGALDRYEWKLIGKKEKFIMANNFKLQDRSCPDAKLLTKEFANPDCVRWELRRVWVVEGKLKPGFRHVYPRRVFYWDEDATAAGLAENYDAGNKLYRIISAITWPYWKNESGGGVAAEGAFNYDLQTGIWSGQGLYGEVGTGQVVTQPQPETFFSPDVLAGEGIR